MCVCVQLILFIRSFHSSHGYSSCFSLLATVTRAGKNAHVQVFGGVSVFSSLGYVRSVESLGRMVILRLTF